MGHGPVAPKHGGHLGLSEEQIATGCQRVMDCHTTNMSSVKKVNRAASDLFRKLVNLVTEIPCIRIKWLSFNVQL